MSNMKLWDAVKTTDPKYTKKANVKGNKITAIGPQYQIMKATEQFGAYGSTWGFSEIQIDYTLKDMGLITFAGTFFYPLDGKIQSFPIINSAGIYKDGAKTKIDDDFAKKVETDALTKALSKIGFNADIFLGKFDDSKYVDDVTKETTIKEKRDGAIKWVDDYMKKIDGCADDRDLMNLSSDNAKILSSLSKNYNDLSLKVTELAKNKRTSFDKVLSPSGL